MSRQLSSSWDPVNEFLSPPNRHIRLPPEGFYEEVCGCVSTEEIRVWGFICKLPKCFLSQNQGPVTELNFFNLITHSQYITCIQMLEFNLSACFSAFKRITAFSGVSNQQFGSNLLLYPAKWCLTFDHPLVIQNSINSLVSPESRNLERTEWMLSTHASFLFMVMDFCLTRSSTVNMNTWFYCAWFTNALIYWPVVISSLLYIINDNTMLLKQRGYVWLQFWKTVPTSLISPTMHKAGS